ncbi:hypothetical protein D3C71_1705890 [compost metagenome]
MGAHMSGCSPSSVKYPLASNAACWASTATLCADRSGRRSRSISVAAKAAAAALSCAAGTTAKLLAKPSACPGSATRDKASSGKPSESHSRVSAECVDSTCGAAGGMDMAFS